MDIEIKQLLKKNLELTEQNNRLIKKMRRSAIFGNILMIVWWAVIIGIPVYLYFTFFEPFLVDLQTAYQDLEARVEGLPQIPDSLRGALENLPGRMTE